MPRSARCLSCKLIDVPPFDYLKDVLMRVVTHPQRLIGQLTPKGWANAFRRQAARVDCAFGQADWKPMSNATR